MLESNNSIELQNLKNTYCSMEFTVDGRIHDNSDGISSSGRGADHPSTCQLKDGDEKMHTSGGKAHSSMTVSSTSVSNPQNLGLSISLTSPDLVQLSSSYNSNIQISNSSLAPLAESSPTSNLASSASGSLENLEFQPTSDAASNIASVLATNDTDPIMEDQITDESHEKSKLVNTISTTAGHIMTKPTNDPMQVDPDVIYLHPNHSLIENPNQSTSAAIDSGILFNSSSEVDHSIKKLAEFKLDTENEEKSGQVKRISPVIPQFYFPFGKPRENERKFYADVVSTVRPVFNAHNDILSPNEFVKVTVKCGLPGFCTGVLMRKIINICGALYGAEKSGKPTKENVKYQDLKVTLGMFTKAWKVLTRNYHEEYSLLFGLLKRNGPGSGVVEYDDLLGILEDVLENHVGLKCINNHAEFQQRYAETVLARFFYRNNNNKCKMSLGQFRKSGFLEDLKTVEDTNQININNTIFSYNYFYVIYCKFIELDLDKDGLISSKDLRRYEHGVLSWKVINRVVDGYGLGRTNAESKAETNGQRDGAGVMGYREFIWFFISEVDKSSPTAIEYWFRILDIDGDSILTVFELEQFYQEQLKKINRVPIMEEYKWIDSFCEMADLLTPNFNGLITMRDLKNAKLSHAFLNCFLNYRRFADYEHRHQIAQQQKAQQELHRQRKELYGVIEDTDEPKKELSEFDKYIEDEYNILAEADARGQYYDSNETSDDDEDMHDRHQLDDDSEMTDPEDALSSPHETKSKEEEVKIETVMDDHDSVTHVVQIIGKEEQSSLQTQGGKGNLNGTLKNEPNWGLGEQVKLESGGSEETGLKLSLSLSNLNPSIVTSPSSSNKMNEGIHGKRGCGVIGDKSRGAMKIGSLLEPITELEEAEGDSPLAAFRFGV